MRIQTTINFEIKTKRPNTGEGGMIRGYLKLDFAHIWLGEVATRFRVLGIYREEY